MELKISYCLTGLVTPPPMLTCWGDVDTAKCAVHIKVEYRQFYTGHTLENDNGGLDYWSVYSFCPGLMCSSVRLIYKTFTTKQQSVSLGCRLTPRLS